MTCENQGLKRHRVPETKAPRADFLVIKRFYLGIL